MNTPITLGVCLPQLGPHCTGDRVAEFARTAEQLGYSSLCVGDRVLTPTEPSDLYPDGGTPEQPYPPEFTAALDPIITLTVAATVTSTVRLGSNTLTATWHNPLLLARSLTTLDQVSRGRLDAGFGISWSRDEYDAVGVPWRGRGARLDEILDVLDTLWTATVVQHTGPLFTLPPSTVNLRPVQDGGPPVLLGGFGPAALKRVGCSRLRPCVILLPGVGPHRRWGRSSRVRPNARDQSSKSPFLWRSDVAVQPDCQRRQQRRRQWEGFTYHDSKDSFRRQMIFAAT
jgi:hypothetical protein